MPTCEVRWRSSGGRGEFEFVPAESLLDREISVLFEPLNLTVPAEVRGVKRNGKSRLRKSESNNREKLHLPQLVMAVARLPEPAREYLGQPVIFPLENKNFVMDQMRFDIVEEEDEFALLAPLSVSIYNSDFVINLNDRLVAVANDIISAGSLRDEYQDLSDAIREHERIVRTAINSNEIRKASDRVIALQKSHFGMTNVASISELLRISGIPAFEDEEVIQGKEGRLLARTHFVKERNRTLVINVKEYFKRKNSGVLRCEVCDFVPLEKYGKGGERCIEAHHRIPIEELQPDSVTKLDDMALVCANCHRMIHKAKPCLEIDDLRALIAQNSSAR